MNDLCDYIEKKKLQDYIQNEVILKKTDLVEWHLQGFEYVGELSGFSTVSLKRNVFDDRKLGNSPFLATILNEDNIELTETMQRKFDEVSLVLDFDNAIQKDVHKILLKLYISNSQKEINISMSGDREFLIYQQSNDGTFKNVLINEDGDVELLFIPSDRAKSYNKTFYREDGINLTKVVSFFNEM